MALRKALRWWLCPCDKEDFQLMALPRDKEDFQLMALPCDKEDFQLMALSLRQGRPLVEQRGVRQETGN